MGPRSRKPLIIACGAAVLGMGALYLFVNSVFLGPYRDLQADLDKASGERDLEHRKLMEFEKKKRRLVAARLLGLPTRPDEGIVRYGNFLESKLIAHGLTKESFVAPTADARPQAAANKKVQSGHVIRAWNIRAKGKWVDIVNFLADFEKTPILHRIRSLQIERTSGASDAVYDERTELSVSMTVEGMVVGRSETRPQNLWGVSRELLAVDVFNAINQNPSGSGLAMLLRAQGLIRPTTPQDRNYSVLKHYDPFRGGLTEREKTYIRDSNTPKIYFDEEDMFEKENKDPSRVPVVGLDIRKEVLLTMSYESIKDVTVKVRPASGSPTDSDVLITVREGDPIELTPSKYEAIEVPIAFRNGKFDRKADTQISVSPGNGAVKADLSKDRLHLTVEKNARPGDYVVRMRVAKAVLWNREATVDAPDEYINLSATPGPENKFVIRGKRVGLEKPKIQARGRVLYVGHRDVYFQAGDYVCCIHVRESIFDAVNRKLTPEELEQLDWWAAPPLGASTLGLMGSVQGGPFLSAFSLFPDRPGLWSQSKFLRPAADVVETKGKPDRIGGGGAR